MRTKEELKELIWLYDQIKTSPTLLVQIAGRAYEIDEVYHAISEKQAKLRTELNEVVQQEAAQAQVNKELGSSST